MFRLIVFDDWLDPPQLEAADAIAQAHFRTRAEAGGDPVFSWYSPKQGRHVSRLSAEARASAQRYIDDLACRLRPFLPSQPGGCDAEPEGYEWWSNFDNTLDWHRDKDETLFQRDKTLVCPVLATVLYTQVSIRGRGGELSLLSDPSQAPPYAVELTADEIPQKCHSIAPRTNQLVVFDPRTLHRIDPFHGSRTSLAVNVWATTPTGILQYRNPAHCHPL